MKRHAIYIVALLLTGLVLFQTNAFASERVEAELLYHDGVTQQYMVHETTESSIKAKATPIAPVITENITTVIEDAGRYLEEYNFQKTEIIFFYVDYKLSYDAYYTITVLVQGPYPSTETAIRRVVRLSGKAGDYWVLVKGKRLKQPGLYSVTGTVRVDGKKNNPILSTETCRFFVLED